MSRFAENGSHLAEADATKDPAGQVGGPGRSGNAGTGSHLAATNAAESHAGQVERSGMSGKCRNRLTPGKGGSQRAQAETAQKTP